MTGWWSGAPIRVRLTVLYTAVLALLLAIYGTATFLAVRHEFREQLEEAEAEHGVDVGAEQHLEQQLGEILFVLVLGFPLTVLLAGAGLLTPLPRSARDLRPYPPRGEGRIVPPSGGMQGGSGSTRRCSSHPAA